MRHSAQARNIFIAAFLLLCIACTTASAATISWNSLSPAQQEALAPLEQQWNTLPEIQQHRLLKTAKRYTHLTPEQKHRFLNRLTAWSKLTPEQRKAAREKYRAFNKVPAEKREQVKQMVKQDQANKAQQSVSGVPAASPSTESP
ncbi:MAG TPA: DUF3106 domain-containing protein [Gallionella sp.]|nr:DUF3106 domain-containing protein [Gallionella sp.]